MTGSVSDLPDGKDEERLPGYNRLVKVCEPALSKVRKMDIMNRRPTEEMRTFVLKLGPMVWEKELEILALSCFLDYNTRKFSSDAVDDESLRVITPGDVGVVVQVEVYASIS